MSGIGRTGSGEAPPRSTAVTVGVLFLVATGFFLAGQALYGPVLSSPDPLGVAYPARTRVLTGIMVEVVGVLAIPLIALVLYPALRPRAETAALMYVGVRTLESVALLVADFTSWSMVSLSRRYLETSAGAVTPWLVAQETVQAVGEGAFLLSVGLLFPIGVLLLNGTLWRTRLVPRAISGWGFAAGILILVGSILVVLEFVGVPELVVVGPIAVQEIVLATWLIARGFEAGSVDPSHHRR